MKIGELAAKAGVKASTIRFYEQLGLMPETQRSTNGYRVYDEVGLERLRLIKFSQNLGFSLDELPQLVRSEGDWDHEQLLQRLEQKAEEITALIEQLKGQKRSIHFLQERLQSHWSNDECMPQEELDTLIHRSGL